MSNNQKKKEAAKIFNENRLAKLSQPTNFKKSTQQEVRKAREILAIAAGITHISNLIK
jgi:hypothetical protein